jgi:predicted type IV restriction endonuclease
MTLEEGIAEAKSYFGDPPSNESNTCDRIVYPLLLAAGYDRREIESRMADNANRFPDYTLLGNTPNTWYLEAKAWNVRLENNHAGQALDYANRNGKRFVVLTNGQAWQLYDNAIQGLPTEKLVACASLDNIEAFTEFMNALSKEKVCSGGLERYVVDLAERTRREAIEQQEKERQAEILSLLRTTVSEQLCDTESEIIECITLYLSEKEEYRGIKAETVAEWYKQLLSSVPSSKKEATKRSTTQNPSLPSVPEASITLNLLEIQYVDINGRRKKPILLYSPDGTQVETRTWKSLAEHFVCWLIQKSHILPIPFGSDSSTRWFVNTAPTHKDGRAMTHTKLLYKGNTIYMDIDKSANSYLKDIYALCLAVNVAPEGFRITYQV